MNATYSKYYNPLFFHYQFSKIQPFEFELEHYNLIFKINCVLITVINSEFHIIYHNDAPAHMIESPNETSQNTNFCRFIRNEIIILIESNSDV